MNPYFGLKLFLRAQMGLLLPLMMMGCGGGGSSSPMSVAVTNPNTPAGNPSTPTVGVDVVDLAPPSSPSGPIMGGANNNDIDTDQFDSNNDMNNQFDVDDIFDTDQSDANNGTTNQFDIDDDFDTTNNQDFDMES